MKKSTLKPLDLEIIEMMDKSEKIAALKKDINYIRMLIKSEAERKNPSYKRIQILSTNALDKKVQLMNIMNGITK